MTKKLMTISAEDSMREAYELMKEKGVRHLPVSEPGGEIVGLLSDRDVQRAITPTKTPSGLVDEELTSLEDFKVTDFMSWPILAVAEDTSVGETISIMIQRKISAILVRDRQGHVDGIITTDDMMRLLQELFTESGGGGRKKLSEAFPNYRFGDEHWEPKGECT